MIKLILILLFQVRLVIGISVVGLFDLPVVQQKPGDYLYVSTEPDTVTQFMLPPSYGMLAHNYLAGERFFDIELNDIVVIKFDDGSIQYFEVTTIEDYRTLTPYDYKSLDTDKRYSDLQLYDRIYNHENRVVFQTCIEKNGNKSWGFRFIIATPIIKERHGFE